MPKILVIVVTYNAMHWAKKCLGSIVDSSVPLDGIVMDNSSTDGTPAFIREHFPQLRLVETGGNLGFGAANNIGLRLALDEDYDFVYLLNQDAWLEKDTVSKLLAAHTPDFGILSPLQLQAGGRQDRRFAKKCSKYIRNATSGYHDDRLVVPVPFVMAAHWLVSRKALLTVGGFSPAFKQYGEDDNYIDRLHYFKMRCGVVPAATAVHDRARRKTSREARMRLKCIATVVKICNPSHSFFWRSIVEPLELVGMGIKNISGIPFRYISELRGRYPELKSLRAASCSEGAFLPR